MSASSAGGLVVPMPERWIVVLSAVIVFYVGVSMLLALCAARRNPRVDHLNVYSDYSAVREPEGELAVETRKLSHRFSSTAAIAKLSASFRLSSFRDPPSSSFRISSFRTDCRSQVDALRRSRPEVVEINAEPAVWQRVILRGERCAPLSFSGLILYDEHGNPLPSNTRTEQDSANNQQTMGSSNEEDLSD